jgi:hypothetical protein
MKRFQLEHIIRAGGSIADDEEIIVLGSSSILAQFPNISEEVLVSIEADVFPKNKPDMADLIDGCIGELSPFHQAFGYYAHGVGKETAGNLPPFTCFALSKRNVNISQTSRKFSLNIC